MLKDLYVPCHMVESKASGIGMKVPTVDEGWSSVTGLCFLADGALELGQLGCEGRRKGSGLRALGLFLAVEMWDCGRRHKCSLREVADSEILARGDAEWICLWMDLFMAASHLYLLKSVLPRGSSQCLDLAWWMSPKSLPATNHDHSGPFLSECVVK